MPIKEACGVFGVSAPHEDVARLTYFALYALQHRGQESAGIAVASAKDLVNYKDMGLVPQIFDERILSILKGYAAIGHVRYSTTGSSVYQNAQPVLVSRDDHLFHHTVAVAHNGNLINSTELKRKLLQKGISLDGSSDTELMAKTIASQEGDEEEATIAACRQFRGAFSMVVLTPRKLMAIRDGYGIRPLVMGHLDGYHCFASETCAFNVIGAEYLEDLEPGLLYVVDKNGLRKLPALPRQKFSLCIFEFIYFARPDSYLCGLNVHAVRDRLGRILAREHPADADVVIPVPDSSTPAAIGYSHESGIPYAEGLIKNRYIHRTFIQPEKRMREMGVRMKLNPLKEVIGGKRVVMVDDSIVRGTTSYKIVKLLKDSGAKEVHVRVSSPPIRYPCYYGIDMATKQELIGHNREAEEIGHIVGADSIGYLSFEGMLAAVGLEKEDFCTACFNDDYPIRVPKQLELGKLMLEESDHLVGKR